MHPEAPVAIAAGDGGGCPTESADLARFLGHLRQALQSLAPLRAWLDPARPITVARAPGRLDIMGGIADYSGSLVLQLPIREATVVAIQRSAEPALRFVSLDSDRSQTRVAELPLAPVLEAVTSGYASLRELFRSDPSRGWVRYPCGVIAVFARECGHNLREGMTIVIQSTVPEGKGVSSSAALEVATMYALAGSLGHELEPQRAAHLCQTAENQVVGAPCGIMDQMTSACGTSGELLELLCQPSLLLGTLPIPAGLRFWGIDSGVRHSVAGDAYARVRVAAFMAYRIIAEVEGWPILPGPNGTVVATDARYSGYLANVPPSRFRGAYAHHLPPTMTGREFLERYGGTTDDVTNVDPRKTYPIYQAAAHAILEHDRVKTFAELLRGPLSERARSLLGELMLQSHASYNACGLGSPETDALLEFVEAEGAAGGLFGARITGGGSGGTVAVVGSGDSGAAVGRVVKRYAARTGYTPHVFRGSSSGAVGFGVRQVARL